MELGIAGRTAIVCASSRGLGKACATALAGEGVNVVVNGRTSETLDAAAQEIRAMSDVQVTPVLGDVTTEEGRQALLAACPAPDILINNNAGPRPGPFLEKTREEWLEALAGEGVNVVVNGRTPETLDTAAQEIRAMSDVQVTPVLGDVTTDEGRQALLTACPAPDILINNNAGPRPGPFLEKTREEWLEALDGNMLAALTLIKEVVPEMRRRRFGRIVNITSAMVTTPRPRMGISAGPRAGLTAVCKTLSVELVPDNITINNLLPERFDTDRQLFMARREMEARNISYEEAREWIVSTIPAGRMGLPEEFGATCAFVCSAHSGFMTGMNIHLDGGAYPGLV